MRAELPWNVAGIPPEAREAARAAARREGLSVGEWLTRRILRSFSGLEEDMAPLPFETRAPSGATLDSWGLPLSAASRRDTEEMMARVGRSESESNDAWRRIEDQLRGLSRRLDSSERSHGESNRVLSRTAQDMNIAAREQAQAFDQLGLNVMALNERLERLERSAAHDGIKDAVKALHQGLSRLADQITATANNSASQVVQLSANLEQLAGRLGQARVDSQDADKALEARIDTIERSAETRLSMLEQLASRLGQARVDSQDADKALEARIDTIDRSADTRLSMLEQLAGRLGQARVDSQDADKALEARIDTIDRSADTRLSILEQLAGRLGQARVDSQDADKALEDRIDAIERSAETRLSTMEKTAQFNTNALDHALEKIEVSANQRATDQVENQKRVARHEESLDRLEDSIARLEMRLPDAEFDRRMEGIERSVSGIAARLEHNDPVEKFGATMQAISLRLETLEKDHNDLLGELRTKVLRPVEPPAYEDPKPQKASPSSAFEEAPPFMEPPAPSSYEPAPFPAYTDETTDAFAPAASQQDFSFDIPPETSDPFTTPPDFAEVFADAPEQENFLAQARRSARAASEKAESERRSRFAGFRWSKEESPSAEDEDARKPRYLVPALVALLVVVAAAAALVLSQRAKQPEPTAIARPANPLANGPTFTVAPPSVSNDTQFVVAPQASDQGKAQSGDTNHDSTQRFQPETQDGPSRTALPLKQHQVLRHSPVNPLADVAKAAANSPDRVIELANAGNPTALTMAGLKALDGTGGSSVNLNDAVRLLTQAAEKGHAVAQYRLGTLYERGQGVAADPVKAAHWYELAANQGNRKAMHNLAVSYASGAAGKNNMAEAARWFAKAAALGLSDSQFNLAVLYERGDGVPQSLLDAYKWYSIAAQSGDPESKARIAVLQTQLSDPDKAAANKSAATFHAAPLNRSANVPPEMADLGD